jgi:hypothetical protein
MSTNTEQISPDAAAKIKSPLSDSQAVDVTHQHARAELARFSAALDMAVPVSIDKLASLLEHLIKEQTSSDSAMIRDQMVRDGWTEQDGNAEQLDIIAERATKFLASEKGIELFNFFVKIFARTSINALLSAPVAGE